MMMAITLMTKMTKFADVGLAAELEHVSVVNGNRKGIRYMTQAANPVSRS